MNPLPPNVDELVSAYLDGEATPDEVVTVESDPELLSRVEGLRALSGAVGSPTSAPGQQKEAHLAAALGLFDDLFGAESDSTDVASPVLASVPDVETSLAAQVATDEAPPVVSLAAARDRRRPRRFNTGVIAAAAAALLLFVGLAALSFGRNSGSDVATADTRIEAAEATADDSTASDDAMDDSDASNGGISELEASRAAEPPAAAAMQAESDVASDDAASMDDAEASMDAAAADSAFEQAADGDDFAADEEGAAVAEAAAPFAFDISLGDFVDDESLREELEQFTAQELRKRADTFESGLFPCQQEIPELAKARSITFVGEATVDRQLVEIHILAIEGQDVSLLIVDPLDDCAVLSTFP